MSKLGVILTSSLSLGGVAAAYVPRSSYPRRDDTYARADDLVAQLNSKFSPGESPRLPLDRITNLAQLFNFPQPPPPSAGGCIGVSQTFTSLGTFTANCTGSLTMEVWGSGATSPSNNYAGQGAGAFAETTNIAVTNGQTWLVQARPANATTGTYASFICPTAIAACVSTLKVCSGTSLTSSNFVCADAGRQAVGVGGTVGGAGGTTANSVGATLFKGGDGGNGIIGNAAGGGGGAAGPDGAGANGAIATSGTGGTGGTGDNGSGGAGGAGAHGTTSAVSGTANVNGGGGGGGGISGVYFTPGLGGAPGGGAGGYGAGRAGGRGQIIVHSDASDVLTPVLTGGSGYGGGTVGMA